MIRKISGDGEITKQSNIESVFANAQDISNEIDNPKRFITRDDRLNRVLDEFDDYETNFA